MNYYPDIRTKYSENIYGPEWLIGLSLDPKDSEGLVTNAWTQSWEAGTIGDQRPICCRRSTIKYACPCVHARSTRSSNAPTVAPWLKWTGIYNLQHRNFDKLLMVTDGNQGSIQKKMIQMVLNDLNLPLNARKPFISWSSNL